MRDEMGLESCLATSSGCCWAGRVRVMKAVTMIVIVLMLLLINDDLGRRENTAGYLPVKLYDSLVRRRKSLLI